MMKIYQRNKKLKLLFSFYVVFAVAASIFMFFFSRYSAEREVYLQELINNVRTGIEINSYNRLSFSRIKYSVHEYATSKSFYNMNRIEKNISEDMAFVRANINALENGGVVVENIPVNYPDLNKISYEYKYSDIDSDTDDPDLIEMIAKVSELESIVNMYRGALIDRIVAMKTDNKVLYNRAETKIQINEKEIDSFFATSEQIFNKYYVNSVMKQNKLQCYYDAEMIYLNNVRKYSVAFIVIVLICGGIGLFVYFSKMISDSLKDEKEYDRIVNNFDSLLAEKSKDLNKMLIQEQNNADEIFNNYTYLCQIFDSVTVPIYVIDVETYKILYSNSFANENWENTDGTCYMLTHKMATPCSGIEHPCPLQIVRSTGKPVIVEHIHQAKDGKDKYYEIRGYPIFSQSGKLTQMVELSIDITDKKQHELSMLQHQKQLDEKISSYSKIVQYDNREVEINKLRVTMLENKLKVLMDNISDVVLLLDGDGKITFTGSGIKKVAGYDSGHITGHFLEDLLHTDDRLEFAQWFESLKTSTTTLSAGFRLMKRSGSSMNAVFTGTNYLTDESILGIVIDIQPNLLSEMMS